MYTFETTAIPSLDLDVNAGHATIVATDTGSVTVEVGPAHAGRQVDREIAEETVVRFDNGRVSVRAPGRAWYSVRNLLGAPPMIHVTIHTPVGSSVRARGEYGDITGEGTLGECAVTTDSGSLRFDQVSGGRLTTGAGTVDIRSVSGSIDISTGDGDVRVGTLSGPSRVRTENGDVVIAEASTDLQARTEAGSIDIGSVHRGTIDLSTSYGPIDVGLPRSAQAYVEASAKYGTVHNRLDPADVPESGPPPLRIRANTAHGDVTLRRP